jgi:hypothetical protein
MDTQALRLHRPMFISARLMAAVRIPNAGTIHIEPVHRDTDGRIVWRHVIEDDHHQVLDDATDLHTGAGDDLDARKTMTTLLAFLTAAAEAYRHTMNGHHSDNADMFPPQVTEWAYDHDDELAALILELEEPAPPRRLRILRRYYEPADIVDGEIAYRDEETDEIDCEPDDHDLDNNDTAITLAAEALRNAGCTQPSTTPGPMTLGDWWTDPDGSHTVDTTTGLRCEPAAFPHGFTTDELNAVNNLV